MSLATLISETVMPKLGLTGVGDAVAPKEGRIAHNLVIPTAERGDVLFRCYPKVSTKAALGYGTQQAKFELRTLIFLAEKGVPTPKPINAVEGGSYAVENDDWFIFAYPTEPGETLKRSDLSASVAKEAGELLASIICVSAKYVPQGDEPNGDIEYIKRILNNFLARRPDMANETVFGDLFNKLADSNLNEALDKTPKGLVHGDFFFENVLSNGGALVGVIDFGDAYYGHVIMDIVIGSMEFAMKEDEVWDFDLFEQFLAANINWLAANNIPFDLFHDVLLTNCARFTAHLCNLQQDELERNNDPKGEIRFSEIPYVARFYMFQRPEVREELCRRYEAAVGQMNDKKLYYGRHIIDAQDIEAVSKAVASDWLSGGPMLRRFEEKFAHQVRARHAVAVSSGTAALHLTALAMVKIHGKQPGDTVITTPLTFVATAAAFIHAGFKIDFVDIDPETWNIDLQQIEDKLRKKEKRFVGVVPVHFAGLPVDMPVLGRLADKYGVWVVEDACHALGGSLVDKDESSWCGDSRYSQATTFSFHPVKHITTGEGGMLTTNHDEVKDLACLLRNHCMDRSESAKGWEYDVGMLGFNYRMTEMQASLGLSQLSRLDDFLAARRLLADVYNSRFRSLPIQIQPVPAKVKHAYHLYVVRTSERDELHLYLKSRNIISQVHYVPLHTFSYFKQNGFEGARFPNAESYYKECLSLPLHPGLTAVDRDRVINAIEAFYRGR